MPNRDTVIYDIERCTCNVPDACKDCSHYTGKVGFKCMENLLTDALTLLKEQEERIKELELEKGWDESPDMMGKW